MVRTLVLLGFFLLGHLSYGQFGDLLKNQGLKLAKKHGTNLLSKELNKTKAKFDSTSFSYAVSLSDKAAQFQNKDQLSDLVTISTMFVDKDKEKTPFQVAKEYMDMGEMYYAANAFKLAEGHFFAANAILISEGAEADPLYGRGLANLGLLYNGMGRYAASEELTRRALEVREKYFGRQSIDYAASLNNLAVLNKDLGNYNEAEKEITEAIAVNLAAVGDEGIAYAISLNNRAVLYQVLGRFEDAENDMQLALSVASKTLKPDSKQYTRFQSNMALLYQQQGKYNEAEDIYQSAISAIAKNPLTSKKTNPDYAHMIENLASLYEVMGKTDEAEKLYLEALDVYEKKFSNQYSGFGLTSARLGALYLTKEDYSAAEKYLTSAKSILTSTYGPHHPNTVDLSVQLGRLYWKKGDVDKADEYLSAALEKSLEFVGLYFAPMSETEKAMYWQTLRPRFETYYGFTSSVDNSEVIEKAAQYRLATKAMLLSGTTKVKNQILSSDDPTLVKDYQTWLDQKGTLAHYYSMSEEELKDQEVNLDSINRAANTLEKSLSERSGLFTQAYQSATPLLRDIQARLGPEERAVEIIRIGEEGISDLSYLALIISSEVIDKVTLSNGHDLEDKHYKLYRNLVKYKKEDMLSYPQFWQPIDAKLDGVSKAFLSLDGVYNQISISSLQISPGQFALDKRNYTIISSLRDLMSDQAIKIKLHGNATLFGDPKYGSEAIAPLPGTGVEVNSIKSVLNSSGIKAEVKTGMVATEQSFKEMSHSGLLHIATHGFFVPDPKKDKTSVFSIPLYNINENVLLRSGLLFAGAGGSQGVAIGGANNGVLSSYEVMNLDLDGTELVVLSACETGLGDVMAGEGVFGLQRAFLVAGASSVIMSLWKVDDEATKQLMVTFYKQWILSGDMEKSFAEAQKTVRNKFNHPYYWGSFVLLRN